MVYLEPISEIITQLKVSLEEGTFAKLTLGKTIGKTELTNIFFRTVVEDNTLKFNVTFRYIHEEIIEVKPIDAAFDIISEYINNPFLTVILFTTEKDTLIKLNKKRTATLSEMNNTFKHADPVLLEYLKK